MTIQATTADNTADRRLAIRRPPADRPPDRPTTAAPARRPPPAKAYDYA